MDEEVKEAIQTIFADETNFLRGVEDQVKALVKGNEFAYRSIMLHMAIARCYGQYDSTVQALSTDFNTAVGHILAEYTAKTDEFERLVEQFTS